MLKITRLSNFISKIFRTDNNKVDGNDSKSTNEIVVNLSKNKKSKNLIYMINIRAIKKLVFLIPNTKKVFNYLRLVFIKVSIF